jgi:putative hydrolase of the HAD superfamily
LLIIFDLDDTLIDTSNSITPKRLEKAVMAMTQLGLRVGDTTKAVKEILELSRHCNSSAETITKFVEKYNGDINHVERGVYVTYYSPITEDVIVKTKEGVKEVLLELYKKFYALCVVTVGEEFVQKQKLEKAGIDYSIFSKIIVSREREKKHCYKKIIEELRDCSKEKIIVCGDRIDIDLVPAKQLGLITVLLKNKYKTYNSFDNVDYIIHEISEIKDVLKNYI